jgi:hypothetical protein
MVKDFNSTLTPAARPHAQHCRNCVSRSRFERNEFELRFPSVWLWKRNVGAVESAAGTRRHHLLARPAEPGNSLNVQISLKEIVILREKCDASKAVQQWDYFCVLCPKMGDVASYLPK